MPTIVPSFTYTDGTALNSSGHNQNVYDTAPGRGLMSTANGGLGTPNLAPNFLVRSEHIMPQTLLRTSDSFALEQIDCFEDAFASDVAASDFSYNDAPGRFWVPVPGCGLRFYLTAQSTCLMRVGLFCHPFKVTYAVDKDGVDTTAFDMAVGLKLDGVLLEQTRRPLPSTARYETKATALKEGFINTQPEELIYNQEETAAWYDLHVLRNAVSPGVHDLQLCVFMESVDISREKNTTGFKGLDGTRGHVKLKRHRYSFSGQQSVSALTPPSGSAPVATETSQYGFDEKANAHILFQRATFGVRHARVLSMV